VKTGIQRVLFAGPWWHEDLMKGIARHCAAHGWHLNLEPALSGALPDDWHGAGILTTLGGSVAQFERFRRRAGCPAVSLSLNHPQIDIPRVGIDNQAAGRMAADHFLERGFTQFAFYDRGNQYVGRKRCDAFARHLAIAGHEVTRLIPPRGDTPWFARQRDLQAMLQAAARPLAVFASDDAAGVEVIEACQSLGLSIPHEVGVLGMLDMPLFRLSTTVPLSSITVDFDVQTRTACEVLAAMMAGSPAPRCPVLFAPTGIAVRTSTDVIAARIPSVARAIRYMMDHFAEPLDVPAIVRASGISQTRLYELFKQDVGQSPVAVLNRIRLDKARRQLRRTRHTIDAVAQDCGFGSRVNLHRQFTRHMAMSPGAYRRQAQQEGDSPI
jgi:LacI family transcriptional regulator